MTTMFKNKPLLILVIVLVLIIGGLLVSWLSAQYALGRMSFKNVTTTQMAYEMRQDEFWSTNRFNTLLFSGRVKSVSQSDNKTTVTFFTADSYSASCQFNGTNFDFRIDQTYKFGAEPYQASRQPKGVLLGNCVLL